MILPFMSSTKMQEVPEELRVHVERYNLYDGKTNSTTLPQTLKKKQTVLSWQLRWNGTVLAAICSNFWMPAGYMVIREAIAGIYICVR